MKTRSGRIFRPGLFLVAWFTVSFWPPNFAHAQSGCPGDCNGNGQVSVDELITAVNAALSGDAARCTASDSNSDGRIDISELVVAVRSALDGCPIVMTPTPNDTAIDESVAGLSAVMARSIPGLSTIIASVTAGFEFGSHPSSSGTGGQIQQSTATPLIDNLCSLGGSAVTSCEGSGGNIAVTITLSNCAVAGTSGGSVTLNGTATISGLGTCVPDTHLVSSTTTSFALVATLADSEGNTSTVTANLSASGATQFGGNCTITGMELLLSGSLSVSSSGGSPVTLEFDDTEVVITISAFDADCMPTAYTIALGGAVIASVTAQETLYTFDLTFTDFIVGATQAEATLEVTLDGTVASPSTGGVLTFDTLQPLVFLAGGSCPVAGSIVVTNATDQMQITYTDGTVAIDTNADGVADLTYPSCLNFEILAASPTPSVTSADGTPTPTATNTPTPTRTKTNTVTTTPTSTATKTRIVSLTPSMTRPFVRTPR